MTLLEMVTANARDEFTATPKVDLIGPRRCCSDFAAVQFCDGETDTWNCPVCNLSWTAPCRN